VGSGPGNDVGKDGVRSPLVAAFAIPPASVAYAQTSKPVKVKVKTSTVAPVLKKDGPYHCSALKYGYRLHAGITDKWHREC
jgi:hypothetical protein